MYVLNRQGAKLIVSTKVVYHGFFWLSVLAISPRKLLRPLLAPICLLSLASSAMAQQAPAIGQKAQPTPQQVRQFVDNFSRNIAKGCLQSRLEGLRNPQGYCNCYAQAFTNRYAAADLVAINTAATSSRIAVDVITLMMAPERRMCKASN